MTATHECERCGKKTTHVVMKGRPNTEYEGKTALRCVMCGTLVEVDVKEK